MKYSSTFDKNIIAFPPFLQEKLKDLYIEGHALCQCCQLYEFSNLKQFIVNKQLS